MIAYKGTYNYKCLGQEYKVGKTYTADNMKMFECGIHFCPNVKDVLYHYLPEPELVILKIAVLGESDVFCDVGVTDKMKVLRVFTKEEYTEQMNEIIEKFSFNEKGNVISVDSGFGYGYRWTRDSEGFIVSKVKHKDDFCIERFDFEWDKSGRLVKKIIPGVEVSSCEYDDRGNRISIHFERYGEEWDVLCQTATITESDS